MTEFYHTILSLFNSGNTKEDLDIFDKLNQVINNQKYIIELLEKENKDKLNLMYF